MKHQPNTPSPDKAARLLEFFESIQRSQAEFAELAKAFEKIELNLARLVRQMP